MPQIKGPAIFLAQFVSENPPFDTLQSITAWARALGFTGVQIPAWEKRLIDLEAASQSRDYCAELKAQCNGLEITELAAHLQGQLVAVHPAHAALFDTFAPAAIRGDAAECRRFAAGQIKLALKASANLGLRALPSFSGSLLWPYLYPWPARPPGLIEEGFQELARRWQPLLDYADECGVDIAFELHPGEDLHDGVTFERFLHQVKQHRRANLLYDPSHFVLQCLDYAGFISSYGKYIKAFHVKDAEFRPSARSGVYGGYADWKERPGRFRSVGDGQVDFKQVFTKLTEAGFSGWAVLEWECCVKDGLQGAREGAAFIQSMLIEVSKKAFDDFAAGGAGSALNRKILGLD